MLVGLVVALLAVELGARVAAGHLPDPQVWSTPETQYKVEQMERLAERGGAEVALVGSSIIDVGVDPSQLGPDVYNAALGAGSIGMVADFTRAVVVPRLDPSTVVIGISSRELNGNATSMAVTEAEFRRAPALREALGTENIFDRLTRWASSVSVLVRDRAVLRDPDHWLGDAGEEWGPTATDDRGYFLGFRDRSYRFGPAGAQLLRRGALENFALGTEEIATLRDLVTGLTADGRRVVLVVTPVSADYVATYPRGTTDHEAFLGVVRDLARDTGVTLVEAGIFEEAAMADTLHVNAAGAQRLTAMVADALER